MYDAILYRQIRINCCDVFRDSIVESYVRLTVVNKNVTEIVSSLEIFSSLQSGCGLCKRVNDSPKSASSYFARLKYTGEYTGRDCSECITYFNNTIVLFNDAARDNNS